MLSTPDVNKRLRQQVNDDDAEDVTHLKTSSYTTKHAMREIIAEIDEDKTEARVNMLHVVATPAEAMEWTEHNINIVDTEGYPYSPAARNDNGPEGITSHQPTEEDETRWTYYHRKAGHQSTARAVDENDIQTGEDMEKLGDNDPFLAAMKEAGILSNQKNQHLDTIQEGEDDTTKGVRYYNDDLGVMMNPHGQCDSKRYKG